MQQKRETESERNKKEKLFKEREGQSNDWRKKSVTHQESASCKQSIERKRVDRKKSKSGQKEDGKRKERVRERE